MTKASLVKEISAETGFVCKDVATMLNSLLVIIKSKMKDGKHIEIRHFGTFKLKTRKPRVGRNPKTNDKVPVPERVVPTFKFSREFKMDIVNNVKPEQIEE
jgi:nucleoid DNA-binding protein